jgi:hypothetical protein
MRICGIQLNIPIFLQITLAAQRYLAKGLALKTLRTLKIA